jgi:plasmid stabilization system protein ParE
MSFAVITTERAARDVEEAAAWWASERSTEQARRWYVGILAAIASLGDAPERCPLATERELLPYELRELHFGLGAKPTHRVLFSIVQDTVIVATVRHAARGPVRPDDLQ